VLSELLIAHESIESFLDEMEATNAGELMRQRDRSTREFREGLTVPWEKARLNNGFVAVLFGPCIRYIVRKPPEYRAFEDMLKKVVNAPPLRKSKSG
jgi:hypothetical protein